MSLFGLAMGMIFASFQTCGMVFSAMLNGRVRYVSPSGPKCFMLILSGPVELLLLLCLIASWTCLVVSCVGMDCSRWTRISMSLSVCCVLCSIVLMMLNEFAVCGCRCVCVGVW